MSVALSRKSSPKPAVQGHFISSCNTQNVVKLYNNAVNIVQLIYYFV